MARILILSTASDALGETGKPTGVWYEELATPITPSPTPGTR